MGIVSKACFFLALASVVSTAFAEKAPPQVEISKRQIDALLTALSKSGTSFWTAGATPSKFPCSFDAADCPAKVAPEPLFNSAGKEVACAVTVGEVDINPVSGSTPHTGGITVHWTMDLSNVPATKSTKKQTTESPTYKFEETAGLVVFEHNRKAKIESAIVTNGGQDMTLTLPYEKSTHITYYPLVYQTIGKEISLCGAFDPKIVNN